ncbi:O-antigen ligase family protein [Winogradskyella sediminis]|uniref:O-antigen ligase family protein n=1 Tax=Winogradskyella sediminis TaxID=1382466 RepID=UPI000E273CB0|nr:O-antigen ligase family protein [Winogradskyella sediminis]REG89314.1 O-antigen ligase [Winogradskyella sediminis]
MKNIIIKYYEYLFCFLIFFLPLEGELRVVPNIILILLGSLYFFVIKKTDFKPCKNSIFITFLAFLGYLIINILWTQSLIENIFIVEKLLIIIVIYLLYLPININLNVKFSFILGVLVAILISVFNICGYILKTSDFNFSEGGIVTEVLITERIYLALMAVLSFVFSLDLIRTSNKTKKAFLIANCIMVVFFILLVSARMALLSLVFIGIYNLIILRKYKILLVGIVLSSVVLSASFMLNENLKHRFLYNNKQSTFIENFKKWEPRVEIWSCVYTIFNEQSITEKVFGYGSFKRTNRALENCYSTSIEDLTKRKWFLKTKYNTHNQFFDVLISIGFIGCSLFTVFLIVSLYRNRKDRINVSIILTFIFVFLVENCFHRQVGVYLFAMVLILISRNPEAVRCLNCHNEEN